MKPELLAQLKKTKVFLIDLKPDPTDQSPLSEHVCALVDSCTKLRPRKIVLIKVTVYDAAFEAFRQAGLPVIDERIPFPGRQQKRFEEKFRAALEKAGSKPAGAGVNRALEGTTQNLSEVPSAKPATDARR